MKVKYLAALAAASVFGMTTLTSCGEPAEVETDVEAVESDVEADPCAADPCAAEKEADPCAADPCAADPCAADPCAAE
ncbi:MAG: hypothetical protein AAGM45_16185 [Cyanobacteria bacterium J06588_5]